MLYPESVVDGIVHRLGGWRLEAECRLRETMAKNGQACPIGQAVLTSSGSGGLQNEYEAVIHTTPPFYSQAETDGDAPGQDYDPELGLSECYLNALTTATTRTTHSRLASPLIGAGARGFPENVAAKVAVNACQTWSQQRDDADELSVVFGVVEDTVADQLISVLEATQTEGA